MDYDLIIELSSDVGEALTLSMPNWKKINERAAKSPSFTNYDMFGIGHHTTKDRLEAARLHLSILKAGYQAKHISSVNFLIRTMADNIFSNLSSALDALSYEINHLYNFKIPLML